MIAPFIKEKFEWIDYDSCWWCGSARQAREHLFKERVTWREEIRGLWKDVGKISGERSTSGGVSTRMYKGREGFLLEGMQDQSSGARRPGNTSIRDLLADRRFIGPVLNFLRNTGVGRVKEGVVFSSDPP